MPTPDAPPCPHPTYPANQRGSLWPPQVNVIAAPIVSDELSPELLRAEVGRRRTFAIISHPDAGKTTLTEKLLLFSGAIQLAGAVRAKKAGRATTSDWMEMERERGISVTTSVMSFEYPHPEQPPEAPYLHLVKDKT